MYSASSNLYDRSKLYNSPLGKPVHLNTILIALGSIHAATTLLGVAIDE